MEYIGIYDMAHEETWVVKIIAENKQDARSKFLDALEDSMGYRPRIGVDITTIDELYQI